MSKKTILTLTGFTLLLIGLLSLILSMVGLKLTYLAWMDKTGIGFLLKLLMVIIGFILIVLSRTDWERERSESQ